MLPSPQGLARGRARSLLPLWSAVVLGCLPPAPAGAQGTLTVFGTLDLNITRSRAAGQSATAMDQGGNLLPSRLGFRGSEDLGNGLSAGFWIESALLPDSGQVQGAFFGRRSTLSLASRSFGELRLGRDYTPTFWNTSQFAPLGTVGVGGSANIIEGWPFGLGGARTLARASNSLGYLLPPALGGFYGQAMVALPEGSDGARYRGLRLGWAGGPVDVALAYGQTPAGGQTSKVYTLGASWDLKAVKLMGFWFDQKSNGDRQVNVLLGATVPVGLGSLRMSYARADRRGLGVDGDDARQWALAYVHPLSRRTALYGAYSRIANRGAAAYVAADSSPAAAPGGTASGLQLGLSHNF